MQEAGRVLRACRGRHPRGFDRERLHEGRLVLAGNRPRRFGFFDQSPIADRGRDPKHIAVRRKVLPERSLKRRMAFMNSISSSVYCLSNVVGSMCCRVPCVHAAHARSLGRGVAAPEGALACLGGRAPPGSWKSVSGGCAEKSNSGDLGFV